MLKRAEEAVADKDHIYALILGAAVNNDGGEKIGYAAPSSKGQADAIATAHAVAGINAASISYVECHGTGTPLGDPIEISALAQAFANGGIRDHHCLIGSVKGNVGHLDVAAGIAGLVKTALSLERERVPGTLHYRDPNPKLDIEKSPFRLASEPTAWPRGSGSDAGLRRAGVSAFGVGGTNVHLVLEEAPVVAIEPSGRSSQILCLSARSSAALDAQCLRLAQFLESLDSRSVRLPDTAYTLAVGRRPFAHRLYVIAETGKQAAAQLSKPEQIRSRNTASDGKPRIAMMFPGQGSQYPGMGEELYQTEPLYREVVDDCCEKLKTLAGIDLLPVLHTPGADLRDEAARRQAMDML
ncbi:MAG: ketoacyl-synthetase C-terminal extension domain-containing protein, partial [Bryobacteraceae bacterium]